MTETEPYAVDAWIGGKQPDGSATIYCATQRGQHAFRTDSPEELRDIADALNELAEAAIEAGGFR